MSGHPTSALSIVRRSYTTETLCHRHPHLQIVLPDIGRLEMEVEGRTGAVSASQIAVIAVGQEHLCWAPIPTRCLIVDLPQRFPTDTTINHAADPFRAVDARLSTIVHVIQVELATGGTTDPLIAEGLGAYLTAALTARSITMASKPRFTASQQRVARAARDYIQIHLANHFTISEIGDAVGASVAHLQRCFRATFDISIVRYIHQARLSWATTLLHTTDLTVIEVALRVGFADPSYFARLFRREYGIAPARYRVAH